MEYLTIIRSADQYNFESSESLHARVFISCILRSPNFRAVLSELILPQNYLICHRIPSKNNTAGQYFFLVFLQFSLIFLSPEKGKKSFVSHGSLGVQTGVTTTKTTIEESPVVFIYGHNDGHYIFRSICLFGCMYCVSAVWCVQQQGRQTGIWIREGLRDRGLFLDGLREAISASRDTSGGSSNSNQGQS